MIRNARLTDYEDSDQLKCLSHFIWQLVYSEQLEKNGFLVHDRQEVRDKREILSSSDTDQLKALLRASAGIQGSPGVAGPPGVADPPGVAGLPGAPVSCKLFSRMVSWLEFELYNHEVVGSNPGHYPCCWWR